MFRERCRSSSELPNRSTSSANKSRDKYELTSFTPRTPLLIRELSRSDTNRQKKERTEVATLANTFVTRKKLCGDIFNSDT